MRQILLFCAVVLFASCGKPRPAKPTDEELGFRKSTAAEVFNLRSRCAELAAKLDSEYDHAYNELAEVSKTAPFLRQVPLSNYNPKGLLNNNMYTA